MDVKYLEYILAIAQQKSISRAAEQLYVSQSTLSQYLQRLEQEVGTPLFVRSRSELTLTPAGALYVEAARSVVAIRARLYSSIAQLQDTGIIRLGVSSAWGISLMAALLPEYRRRCPGVTVQIAQNKHRRLQQQLADGKLDMILTAVDTVTGFKGSYRVLRMEELALATPQNFHYNLSHPGGKHILREEQFKEIFSQENFIRSELGSTLRMAEETLLEQIGLQPKVVCEVNDNNAAIKMVEGGVGVAFVPADYLQANPAVIGWYLDPPLQRFNLLAWRQSLVFGNAERTLMELVEQAPLFRAEQETHTADASFSDM